MAAPHVLAARAAKAQEEIAARQATIEAKLDRALALLELLLSEKSLTRARKAASDDADRE